MSKRHQKELKNLKAVIKQVEKGYGTEMCKSYSPGCPNCEAQILLGHLYNVVSLIEWENDQARKEDKTVAVGKRKAKKTVHKRRNSVL